MINKTLLDGLQPGSNFSSMHGLKPRKSRAESSTGDQAAQLDRFDPTPSSPQGEGQSFAFQFRHLSIRREIAAVRAATQDASSETRTEKAPKAVAYSRAQEERQTELSLFYARTKTISVGMGQGTSDHLQNTSQNVGRTFEVSISLDASFLHQFAGQSETFASGDQALFDKYLSTTDQMTGLSGEAAQGFFDMVNQALEETQSAVMDGLEGFLNQAGASMGLEGDALNNFKSQVAGQVAGFFADLDKFVEGSRQQFALAGQSQLPLPAPTGIQGAATA